MQDKKDETTIGGRLKIARENKHLSQVAVSLQLHIDKFSLSRMENCRQDIPVQTLKRFCELYKVSADYLLGLNNSDNSRALDLNVLSPSQISVFLALYREFRDLQK